MRKITKQNNEKEDNFNQNIIENNSLKQECFYKFKNLISEEESVQLDSILGSQDDANQKVRIFKDLIESINKYIEIIADKIGVGQKILEHVERLK